MLAAADDLICRLFAHASLEWISSLYLWIVVWLEVPVCLLLRKRVNNLKLPEDGALKLTCQPEEPPFTRTGVDYFGPITIKVGRTTRKRYGVLFTCLSCRAVHLEVAQSLDTSSFIDALRRFMARRGPVKEL